MRYAKVVVALTAVLTVVAIASTQTSPASPQAPRQAASPDTAAVDALTTEIRALRAELAESARTGLRLQLLTARIQAQEQRIIYLDRQRAEATTRRVNVEQERNDLAAQTQRFTSGELSALPIEQRKAFEFMLGDTKRRLAEQDRLIQQAQMAENDAVNALTQEQGRWGDLNTRLDDLERTLGR